MDSDYWHSGQLMGFDLETTGRYPSTARIVTASMVVIDSRGDVVESKSWLACPEVEIAPEVAEIHGITDKHARQYGEDPSAVTSEVIEALNHAQDNGVPVVTHNGQYDLTVLDREAQRYGHHPFVPRSAIDTIVLDRQMDKWVKGKGSRTLEATAERYQVDWTGDAHTSDADALVAARIAQRIGRKYRATDLSAENMTTAQKAWAKSQMDSLASYFQSKGVEHDIDSTWPVIPGDAERLDPNRKRRGRWASSLTGVRGFDNQGQGLSGCSQILSSDRQCGRAAKSGSAFCWQHG